MRGGARAVLALQGKSKPFGTIEALKRIHRRLRPGEVIGLMRHNDAGKSTLVSMVAQNTSTCSGRIPLNGKPQPSREPEDARQHGIVVIHPDLARSAAQRAGEDVFLGCKLWRRIGLVRPLDDRRRSARAADLFAELKSKTRPNATSCACCRGGQGQAMVMALNAPLDPRHELMDEPTAALGICHNAPLPD